MKEETKSTTVNTNEVNEVQDTQTAQVTNTKSTQSQAQKNQITQIHSNDIKLITTNRFKFVDCRFYLNTMCNEIVVPIEDIERALGHTPPYTKVKDLHQFSLYIDRYAYDVVNSDDEYYNRYYNYKGIEIICEHFNDLVAMAFKEWCQNEVFTIKCQQFSDDMTDAKIKGFKEMFTLISEYLNKSSQILNYLMQSQRKLCDTLLQTNQKQKTVYKPKSQWYIRMNCKYELLEKELKISRNSLYSMLYKKIEEITGIEINTAFRDYCIEKNLFQTEAFKMDCIEDNDILRQAIESIVDEMLLSNKIIPKSLLDKFNANESLMRIPSLLS